GQLGYAGLESSVPKLVATHTALNGKTVREVAAGASHSLALCTDGTVAGWGYAGKKQLGSREPVTANAGFEDSEYNAAPVVVAATAADVLGNGSICRLSSGCTGNHSA
ncbi:MAG: hypothetical protein JNG86_10135, partial [Verrucomicrobiaceae bacterium]|nr:hypothetical protein [Verrucomicrobiaceae bacterium]